MTPPIPPSDPPRVALITYSTKPRGGVVHTLSLAEAMVEGGMPVRVVSLGDPDQGFYRLVRAPYTLVPAAEPRATLEVRVFASVDALEQGLASIADEVDIFHTQDCISARAAARVRDAGVDVRVVRTVHHVDDFTTAALIECQRQAILEPDQLVAVSQDWRTRLHADYGRTAVVIHNGVDATRFPPAALERPISYFTEGDDGQPELATLTRAADRRGVFTPHHGLHLAGISGAYAQFRGAAAVATIDPGADSGDKPLSHSGEELVLVTEGALAFDFAGTRFELGPGDSLHFIGDQRVVLGDQAEFGRAAGAAEVVEELDVGLVVVRPLLGVSSS